MERVFNLENPFWCFMGKVFDLAILNIVWLICSLPIVTIGASTTAMSYTVMKLSEDKEGYILKDYFKAFKSNFRQSTVIWLISLAVGSVLFVDLWWYYKVKLPFANILSVVVSILTVLSLMVFVYVFPILARCIVSIKKLLMLAFMMAIKNIGWTIFLMISIVCTIAVGLFVCAPILLFAPGIIAYIHSKIFTMIFRQYHLMIA